MSGDPASRPEDARAPLTERVSFSGHGPDVARAFAAVLGFYIVVILCAGTIGFLVPYRMWPGLTGQLASQTLILILGAVMASMLWRLAKWSTWRDQGWLGFAPGLEAFSRGLGIGVLMAVGVLFLLVASGNASVSRSGDPFGAYAGAAFPVFAMLAVAALTEELLFRGLPLSRLASATGPLWASVILASGFVGIHTSNPGVTTLGLFNVGLASLLLSLTFFFWGGLPAAWGLHLGWNAGLVLGADAPVSGLGFGLPVFEFHASGPEWISGGSFGPEGGVMATLVMVAATVVLGRRSRTGGDAA